MKIPAALLKNWKTTIIGLITTALSVPAFVNGIHAWAQHKNVDWREVLVSTAITLAGSGLVFAKDSTTHSTEQEVEKATAAKAAQP